VVVSIIAVTGWLTWSFVSPQWPRMRLLYWQRSCLHYEAPPGQVVCWASNGSVGVDSSMVRIDDPEGGSLRYRDMPSCLENFCTVTDSGLTSIDATHTYVVLFLHERSCARRARLVTVYRPVLPVARDNLDCSLVYDVVEPYTWFAGGLVHHRGDASIYRADRRPFHVTTNAWRFYAGQPDPADASHFSIGYDADGKPGTIDGWLLPDDQLRFQIRNRSALQRSGGAD
jgi:hypothetical protein